MLLVLSESVLFISITNKVEFKSLLDSPMQFNLHNVPNVHSCMMLNISREVF